MFVLSWTVWVPFGMVSSLLVETTVKLKHVLVSFQSEYTTVWACMALSKTRTAASHRLVWVRMYRVCSIANKTMKKTFVLRWRVGEVLGSKRGLTNGCWVLVKEDHLDNCLDSQFKFEQQ